MSEQDLTSDSSLLEWIEIETRPVDLVASWESLCDVYERLKFTDVISDNERLEEFKWIIHRMNTFLTKMKNQLIHCKNLDAAINLLKANMIPVGAVNLDSRQTLAYQKLRQQWIKVKLNQLETKLQNEMDL